MPHRSARNQGFEILLCLGSEDCFLHGGGDGTGDEEVHADLSVLEFVEPGAREGAQCQLACCIDAEAGIAFGCSVRSGHEDGATIVEERQCFLHGEEGAAHVEVEGLIEVLLGDLAQRHGLAYAGACEQDVDAALLPLDCVEEAVEVVEIGRVSLDTGDVSADQLDGLVECFLLAAGYEDVGAFFDK